MSTRSVRNPPKACIRCGLVKPMAAFYAHPQMGDGHLNACKDCVRRDAGVRYRAKRAEINEKARARNAANPERNRERAIAWARANPERKSEQNKRKRTTASHRAKVRNAFVENVDRWVVFTRDKGRCGICGGIVLSQAFDIDHVMPLARGGAHSYANVQLAHPLCNRRKYTHRPERIAA